MNVHESEKISGRLSALGLKPVEKRDDADVIVFNTCCIRDTAEKKIYGNIGELKNLKKKKKDLIVAIVGCMSQQTDAIETLKSQFPFIDIILGTSNAHLVADKVNEIINNQIDKRVKYYENTTPSNEIFEEDKPLRNSYPNGWVNIMYGCNNHCTYCIVPYVRGPERSRAPDLIINETKQLLNEGYKEITYLGQNVNSYNHSTYNFAKLLDEVASLPQKFRIRFMTSHPKDLSDEILEVIANHKKICKSIHLPVQAGSNTILKAMNRHYNREYYLNLVSKIRDKLPECVLTTDIMVGFPGETESDFLETLDLVEKIAFSNAFTFVYSPRSGTVASRMVQISPQVKKDRITRLVALQNEIVNNISHNYLNSVFEVLVDGMNDKGLLYGRAENGRIVTFPGDEGLVGEFVNVVIDKCRASVLGGHIDNRHA
jgi:tRNA-2-methylthio-N6-dimethylallyladenosine synthase